MALMRSGFVILTLVAVLGAVAACGTVRGAGQDIQNTGKAIKRAAS